jgi:pimeloyl-ACP methyl ester carboxylesterase
VPGRPMGDVIVLLPGITGSVLQKDGRDVWAISAGAAVRALTSLGRSISDLILEEDPADVDDLGDGVTAPRVVPDTHLIPGLWKIDGYTKVARAVQETFDVRAGENFFEFSYDWRRDNRVAARRLARMSHDWLSSWRDRSGNADAKLILIGHSMGGLVSRYFLEAMEGWKDTRLLLTFGTPYRGSLNALDFVANGMKKKLGPITLIDLSDLLRSFTSVYQLLPIYPCFDGGDGQLVRLTETDRVPNLDADRAAAARGFHEEIREAVDAHVQDGEYVERGYRIHPIVGMFQRTSQSARVTDGGLEILHEYRGEDQDGDGTVPRVSATPLELSNQQREVFVADRHGSLQNADPVLVQMAGLLSGIDLDLSAYYALNTRLSLDLDDAYGVGQPVEIRVRPEDPSADLTASVLDTATGETVARASIAPTTAEWRRAELAPLPAGTYRITVRGEGPVDPVTDVFVVVGEEADEEPPS